MKRMFMRIVALAMVLCLCLSALPVATAYTPFEPGPLHLSVSATKVNNSSYSVTYTARLTMLEKLARAATVYRSDDRMFDLRFICTLSDDLVVQLDDVDEDDFAFFGAEWEGEDIFIYEDAKVTDEGLKIYYTLNERVLKDWRTAKTSDVKDALMQPMKMTATKTVSAREFEEAGDDFVTYGKVELQGSGIKKYFGITTIIGHEGTARLGEGGWGDLGDCPRNVYCPAGHFTDLNLQLWYHDGIHFCAEHNYMIGMDLTTFAPYGNTTRGQIVTILWRMEECPDGEAPVFTDVAEGKYYYDAVAWAAENEVVLGYGYVEGLGEQFGPDDPITREQMAAIMWRYSKYKGYDVSVGEETNILSYGDALTVSEYAIPAMQWACGEGLINGIDGNLEPQGYAIRAQAAAIIQRYCLNVRR